MHPVYPLTGAALALAAEFWASARRAGMPTTRNDAPLDVDFLVTTQAALLAGLGDTVTIATRNVAHLGRFPGIDAREWWTTA